MNPSPGHSATSTPDRTPAWPALVVVGLLFVCGAAGCTSELTCRELGCDPGQTCDRSTGECVERADDCTQNGCPAGTTCNPTTGECRPEAPPCPTTPCPRGYVCETSRGENPGEGVCVPESNCSKKGCSSPAETCDRESGQCVPKPCESHSDCPAKGFVCGAGGTCESGCLLDRDNCPTGRKCRPPPERGTNTGTKIGECRQTCQSHQDCPYGQECPPDSSICTPEGPCDSDGECRSDEVCRDGTCAAPPCSSDEDCPGTQICDLATGVCLGGDCPEDNFAPNYTPDDAASIGTEATLTGLSLCPGRSDWFALQVESGQAVRFRLEHDVTRDVDLMLYDEFGRVVDIDEQAPPTGVHSGRFVSSTTFVSRREQTVRLRIYSHRRETGGSESSPPLPERAEYGLRIRRDRTASCSDDVYEENDSRSEATELPSNTGAEPKYRLQICGSDHDWFVLPDVSAASQLQARLSDVAPEDDHLRFDVLSASGEHFSLTPSQALQLLRTGPEQSWYLRVSSRTGRTASYAIRYRIEGSYKCPEADQHSTVDNALKLAPRTQTTYQLCPLTAEWEVDWIELDSPPSTAPLELTFEAVEPRALPTLDVALYEEQTSGLKLLRAASDQNGTYQLQARIEPSQDLLLRVGPPPNSDRPGTIQLPPKYRVQYRYRP